MTDDFDVEKEASRSDKRPTQRAQLGPTGQVGVARAYGIRLAFKQKTK
jgi:hypothetical protein